MHTPVCTNWRLCLLTSGIGASHNSPLHPCITTLVTIHAYHVGAYPIKRAPLVSMFKSSPRLEDVCLLWVVLDIFPRKCIWWLVRCERLILFDGTSVHVHLPFRSLNLIVLSSSTPLIWSLCSLLPTYAVRTSDNTTDVAAIVSIIRAVVNIPPHFSSLNSYWTILLCSHQNHVCTVAHCHHLCTSSQSIKWVEIFRENFMAMLAGAYNEILWHS